MEESKSAGVMVARKLLLLWSRNWTAARREVTAARERESIRFVLSPHFSPPLSFSFFFSSPPASFSSLCLATPASHYIGSGFSPTRLKPTFFHILLLTAQQVRPRLASLRKRSYLLALPPIRAHLHFLLPPLPSPPPPFPTLAFTRDSSHRAATTTTT